MDYVIIELDANAVCEETRMCDTCKKKTTQKVFYTYPSRSYAAAAGGIVGGAVGAVVASLISEGISRASTQKTQKVYSQTYNFLFECLKCGVTSTSKSESVGQLKTRFGYSKMWGFRSEKFRKRFRVPASEPKK